MILKEKNLFNYKQLKHGVIKVDTPMLDSINDEISFYIIPSDKKRGHYTITDDGYSLDSPTLYANKALLTDIITSWNPKIKVDKADDIIEHTIGQKLNEDLENYLHTLVFAQGVDYVLTHISGKSHNIRLAPVFVSRKLDGLANTVKRKHIKSEDFPGLISNLKHHLGI